MEGPIANRMKMSLDELKGHVRCQYEKHCQSRDRWTVWCADGPFGDFHLEGATSHSHLVHLMLAECMAKNNNRTAVWDAREDLLHLWDPCMG
jgi:hypothetical protein